MSAAHSSDSGIYPKTQGFTELLSAADIYLPQQPIFPEEPSAASKTPLSELRANQKGIPVFLLAGGREVESVRYRQSVIMENPFFPMLSNLEIKERASFAQTWKSAMLYIRGPQTIPR